MLKKLEIFPKWKKFGAEHTIAHISPFVESVKLGNEQATANIFGQRVVEAALVMMIYDNGRFKYCSGRQVARRLLLDTWDGIHLGAVAPVSDVKNQVFE